MRALVLAVALSIGAMAALPALAQPPATLPWSTGFEPGDPLGTLSGDAAAGGWHVESSSTCPFPFAAHTGSNYLHEGADPLGYEANVSYHYYTLPALDFSGSFSNLTLSLSHWQQLAPLSGGLARDGFNLKLSTDGGTVWTLLDPVLLYPNSEIDALDDVTLNEPGWGQSNPGWAQDTFNLAQVQRGLASARHTHVTFASYQETKIRHFHALLDKHIAA